MMPSRGLHLARGQVLRLNNPQTRNLSSTASRIRSTRILSSTTLTSSRAQAWRLSAPLSLSAVSAIRHASTNPGAAATTTAAAPPSLPEAAAGLPGSWQNSSLDTINLDNIDLSAVAAVPERIGFMAEMGLDYGWGVTSSLQFLLEHMHITAGLPWWGSILGLGVLFRAVMLPLYIKSADITARTAAMAPVTAPLMAKLKEARASGDNEAVMVAMKNLSMVRKRAGLSAPKQLAPMAVQAVVGYCGFKLMRAMSGLPVPGLDDGGFLWLTDLTVPDPFLILPVTMGLCVHLMVRLGGETGSANTEAMPPGMRNIMVYGMPTMIAVITGFQPGAVAIWFAGSGAIGMIQGLLLQRPKVRTMLGIAPIYRPGPGEAKPSNAFAEMMETFQKDSDKSKKAKPRKQSVRDSNASAGPTYQAPNLRTRPAMYKGGPVIDLKKTSKSSKNRE